MPTRVDIDAAARCLLVSEVVRSHARAEGYSLRDSAIGPSGIDASLFEAASERSWAWRLPYVGRIDERKGWATPSPRWRTCRVKRPWHWWGRGDRLAFLPTLPRVIVGVLIRAASRGRTLGLAIAELTVYGVITVIVTWHLESGLLREAVDHALDRRPAAIV